MRNNKQCLWCKSNHIIGASYSCGPEGTESRLRLQEVERKLDALESAGATSDDIRAAVEYIWFGQREEKLSIDPSNRQLTDDEIRKLMMI